MDMVGRSAHLEDEVERLHHDALLARRLVGEREGLARARLAVAHDAARVPAHDAGRSRKNGCLGLRVRASEQRTPPLPPWRRPGPPRPTRRSAQEQGQGQGQGQGQEQGSASGFWRGSAATCSESDEDRQRLADTNPKSNPEPNPSPNLLRYPNPDPTLGHLCSESFHNSRRYTLTAAPTLTWP
eukprot:scaffold837_cov50-Phaeocystis_antarctica.AAC.4